MKAGESFISPGHRYFLAVAESGSVRAAARSLNVAASAISRQLIMLEQQLGIALFDRAGRRLILSPAGETLRDGLRRAVQENDDAIQSLNALRGLKRGRLRIATVESVSVSLLPDVLRAFAAAYPGIEAIVTVAGSDAVTELVRDHAADVGLTFNPTSLEGLEAAFTRDFLIGAIMAPDHPLAGAKSLTLAECLPHRLAWPSRGLSIRVNLDRALPSRGAGFHPAIECNSLRLMAAIARRGGCIAFQPRIGIERDLASGALIWVPLTGKRLAADRLMAVCRRGQKSRATTEAFLAMFRRQFPAVRK